LLAVPVVLAFALSAPPLAAGHARPLFALAFTLLLFLSVASAYQGSRAPWKYIQPPAHPTRDAATGALGFRLNLRWPIR
jgi:hypothetical protein